MALLAIQKNIKQQLSKCKLNFKKISQDKLTKSYLETWLEIIDAKWSDFTKNHYDLVEKAESVECSYFKEDIYNETQELYIELRSELKALLDKYILRTCFQDTTASDSQSFNNTSFGVKNNVKLPKLIIPVFSGIYSDWRSFRDLFVSLVHNNSSLDDVQKLHYLKGHLRGEAEQLLRHIPITNRNYSQCWTTLEHRYDNKQFLANSMLNDFFKQKKMILESATDIKKLLHNTLDMINGMKSLGINVESWDVLLIYIISSKLDQESRKLWESKVSEIIFQTNTLPDFNQFQHFLEMRFHSLEFLDSSQHASNKAKENVSSQAGISSKIVTMLGTEIPCIFCKCNHKLSNCKDFSQVDSDSKRKFVQENRICFNCLTPNHRAKYCRSVTSCRICKRRHHSLLHPKVTSSLEGSNKVIGNHNTQYRMDKYAKISHSSSHSINQTSKGHVLLPTALVTTKSCENEEQIIRTVIDQGSQASFVTAAVVKRLGLNQVHFTHNSVASLGYGNIRSNGIVTLSIQSHTNPASVKTINAYVIDRITANLPTAKVEISWPSLETVKLADPTYNTPSDVDMLLGAGVYSNILRDGVIKSPSGTMVAQNTTLGWIISGEIQ